MDLDLTGKLAPVTGSTRGIGLATALGLGLARMGAGVIVNGRTEPAIEPSPRSRAPCRQPRRKPRCSISARPKAALRSLPASPPNGAALRADGGIVTNPF